METESSKVLVRVVTAFVLLLAVLLLTISPNLRIGFSLFISLLAGIGLCEYYGIVRAREISPETLVGVLSGAAVTLSGHFCNPALTNLMLYGGCFLVAASHIVRGRRSVAGLATSVFGVFYVGWFAAHVTLLRAEPGIGAGLVIVLLVAVVLTDAAAYLFGSLLGKHKLARRISPNKTWEGAIAGFVVAVLGMAALYRLSVTSGWDILPEWSLAAYLCTGALLTVAAQVGDLAESCLKRDAGLKDSGVVLPGHGGVLDRCDGYLFAAPVLYYIMLPVFTK